MQRIPNPGSDLDIFVRIFQELYELLKDRPDFDLDDMTLAMIQRNNVSSQGAIGEEALLRSTRTDRSRDPLYNQSKMYAELFRTLGWFQSTSSSLRFAFSWTGEHIATTKNPKALVIECLLGMAYPNEVLGVQSGQSIRIFSAILRTMAASDGRLSRDEMIIGPLNLPDDRSESSFLGMVELIKGCRTKKVSMPQVIASLSAARKISHVTMGNYTRFPIAAIQWAGWAVKRRGSFELTTAGSEMVHQLEQMQDVRLDNYQQIAAACKPAFIRFSAYRMLNRAGFDLAAVADIVAADRALLKSSGVIDDREILFSPFQQIGRGEVNSAFPNLAGNFAGSDSSSISALIESLGDPTRNEVSKARVVFELVDKAIHEDDETELIAAEIQVAYAQCHNDIERTISTLVQTYSSANQMVFYPLVAAIFRLLGFSCEASRRGVNYNRADAMLFHPEGCIPIEIKSPGEETEISVKGVRQALENKIILLSRGRKGYPVSAATTSLVVGFNTPNMRSEVHELIEDIYNVYGFSIGVIDFRSLLKMAIPVVINGRQIALQDFHTMKGVIHVDRV